MFKDGDANTSFLHKVVNMRRSSNAILTLTSVEGTLIGGAELQHHIHYHLKNLFNRAAANRIEMNDVQWQSTADFHVLESDFLEEEVKKAVWN